MKVNRTYSMDYDLVVKLAKKLNQSREVCRAVRKHLENRSSSLEDYETKVVLNALLHRKDISAQLKAVIEAELWK